MCKRFHAARCCLLLHMLLNRPLLALLCVWPTHSCITLARFATSVRVPLPPVGRGWGELLYLDDDLRIQRDVRGDMLVATKVRD